MRFILAFLWCSWSNTHGGESAIRQPPGHNPLLSRRQAILWCCIRKRAAHALLCGSTPNESTMFFWKPQTNRLLVPAEMSDVTFKRLQTQSSMHVTGPAQLNLFYVPVTRAVSVHLTTLLFFSVPRRLSRDPDMQQPERHTGGIRPLSPRHSRKSDPGVLLDLISSPQHH